MIASIVRLAAAFVISGTLGASAQNLMSLGQHLSNECTSCHTRDGQDRGIPSITGWDIGEFVETMTYYQSGARKNPVMTSVAESLDETQIRALATYLNSLPKPPKATIAKK